MIELLVVITVIGMLAALLIPAIGMAINRAKEAAVSAELNLLSTAMVNFRNKYGEYPPSRILLIESGNYGQYMSASMGSDYRFSTQSSNDISTYDLAARSLSALRKFWGRMPINTGASFTTATGWPDFNGNGTIDAPYVLQGDECLTWFLGGVPSKVAKVNAQGATTGYQWVTLGTGASPIMPFPAPANGVNPMQVNRVKPFFDFKSDRLIDPDGDGIPSYADSHTGDHPIIYFCSYGGYYDPNDCNFDRGNPFVETDSNGTVSPPTLKFHVPFPVKGATTAGSFAASPAPNPYAATSVLGGNVVWQQPSTYQLIAAGRDGMYGLGGSYFPNDNDALPVEPTTAGAYNTSDGGIRLREYDNITNFHASRLN